MKKNNLLWFRMYEKAMAYYNEYGNLEVPQNFRTNDGVTYDKNGKYNLEVWVRNQRKNCNPSSNRGKLLLAIGMRFSRKYFSWEKMYEKAKAYYENYGHLEVPQKFKTNDGVAYDKNGKYNLGMWIYNQRLSCNPESERGQLLLNIGMRFTAKYPSWEEMYEVAKVYYNRYGNLEVPYLFRTNDGIINDEKGRMHLGVWIHGQRWSCSPESERGQLLFKIGMRFETRKKSIFTWEEMYELAKSYYKKYKTLEIPVSFKTNDGVTYDKNGKYNLGMWIATQRNRCNPESERGELLFKIGMRFETRKRNIVPWEEMYELAKAYYETYGDLEVSLKFKTNDGVVYDKNGKYNLGIWVSTQRNRCNPASERGQLLLNIGMRFEVIKPTHCDIDEKTLQLEWLKMYSYALKYYTQYGDLDIISNFKIDDNVLLGKWISEQRNLYKRNRLSDEQVYMLESIGMIWNTRKNKFDLAVLCDENNIDIYINEAVLKHKSFSEFNAKLSYLKNNNINFVDENGILHEIFSMSSLNMEAKYGISLESLIKKYNETLKK